MVGLEVGTGVVGLRVGASVLGDAVGLNVGDRVGIFVGNGVGKAVNCAIVVSQHKITRNTRKIMAEFRGTILFFYFFLSSKSTLCVKKYLKIKNRKYV